MVQTLKDALSWMPIHWRVATTLSPIAIVCGLLIWSLAAIRNDGKSILDEMHKDAREDRIIHREERAEDRAVHREMAKEIAAAVAELRRGNDVNRELLLEVRRAVGKP